MSPGPGVSSIERLGPTEIVLYVDNTRDVVAVVPRPAKVRYRLLGGELLRDSAPPVGATAPFTYGAYVTSEVVAKGVVNIPSTQPIFKAVDLGGSPMPSSVSGASAANIGTITYHLVLKQKTQNANTTMEITTDVTPRNR